MAEIDTIQKIRIGNREHQIEVEKFGGKTAEDYQLKSNMVTSISYLQSADRDKYPSAGLVYDLLGEIADELSRI